jgi:hypothetical protein
MHWECANEDNTAERCSYGADCVPVDGVISPYSLTANYMIVLRLGMTVAGRSRSLSCGRRMPVIEGRTVASVTHCPIGERCT